MTDGSVIKLPDPYALPESGWKCDVEKWSNTDYGCIYTYLINTLGSYDDEAMKVFKSLEVYNHFVSGHVKECRYHPAGQNGVLLHQSKGICYQMVINDILI